MEDGVIGMVRARLEESASAWPLYRRLAAVLEAEIQAGRLRQGEPLPGERALATGLGLSRVTVRRALDELTREGLLARRHGARTEVNARVEKALSGLTSFSEDMRLRGMEPASRWLRRALVRPSPLEIMSLGVSAGTLVWRLERVRLADGRPIAREIATVPAQFLPDAHAIDVSLYEVLEARGHLPFRAVQRMRAARMTDEDRRTLACDGEIPVLEVERRCYLASGEVLETTRSRYRGDVYDFVVELTR